MYSTKRLIVSIVFVTTCIFVERKLRERYVLRLITGRNVTLLRVSYIIVYDDVRRVLLVHAVFVGPFNQQMIPT